MRPSAALQLLINQRVLLLLTTLLVFSALLGTAAVSRSGGGLFAFYSGEQPAAAAAPPKQPHQQQPQQPQQPQQDKPEEAPAPLPPPVITTTSTTIAAAVATTTSDQPEYTVPPVPAEEYKYFHEAGGTLELVHYDARYFKGAVPYAAHRVALTNLIQSYLSTFSSLDLETWIAHGTLLGWFWNQQILPWDHDVDVQVSGKTMEVLAAKHNQSRHTWTYTDDATGEEATAEYLLDVNPFAVKVDRGRGQNTIDARWIDVATGMYVDITGLVERDPKKAPGVFSCKNHHGYRQEELYPMRVSEFEGVPALVPWEYEKILVGEYGEKSLVVTEFHG